MASSYIAHDVEDFVAWLLTDTHLDVRTVTIATPELTMGDLATFFNMNYVVVSPIPRPPFSDKPYTLVLRRKTYKEGPCTCETPFCCIREGQMHVPIAGK